MSRSTTVRRSASDSATLPSQVSGDLGWFDRFATATARVTSRAWFFVGCVLLVLIWVPSFLVLSFDAWQLVINTVTTIITFLMVALLQNSQMRDDLATQHKLNAIAEGLADLMDAFQRSNADCDLADDIGELVAAVGLEDRESSAPLP